MAWTDMVGDVLKQYAGGAPGGNAEADFDSVAQHAPQDNMQKAILDMMQGGATQGASKQDIGSIVSRVFGAAGGEQKAGILNTLLSAVGPTIIQQVLRHMNLGSLAESFSGGQVTAEQAQQVPPEAAGQMAQKAKEQDPNTMNALSGFLSGNPGLLKSLGGGALSSIMTRIAQ